MHILKFLDKSNCRKCGEPTCLVFAAAVARGKRTINECPGIGEDVIVRFSGEPMDRESSERNAQEVLNRFKGKLMAMDFDEAAGRLGAGFRDGKLTIKVCGKDFSVDLKGNFSSETNSSDQFEGLSPESLIHIGLPLFPSLPE